MERAALGSWCRARAGARAPMGTQGALELQERAAKREPGLSVEESAHYCLPKTGPGAAGVNTPLSPRALPQVPASASGQESRSRGSPGCSRWAQRRGRSENIQRTLAADMSSPKKKETTSVLLPSKEAEDPAGGSSATEGGGGPQKTLSALRARAALRIRSAERPARLLREAETSLGRSMEPAWRQGSGVSVSAHVWTRLPGHSGDMGQVWRKGPDSNSDFAIYELCKERN